MDEDSITDTEDFASYGAIFSCLAIVAFCAMALILALAHAFGAPIWVRYVVYLVYATLPYAAFMRWAWNREAVRFPNGRVVAGHKVRRLALAAWSTAVGTLLILLICLRAE
jgi:hypothetical protein